MSESTSKDQSPPPNVRAAVDVIVGDLLGMLDVVNAAKLPLSIYSLNRIIQDRITPALTSRRRHDECDSDCERSDRSALMQDYRTGLLTLAATALLMAGQIRDTRESR